MSVATATANRPAVDTRTLACTDAVTGEPVNVPLDGKVIIPGYGDGRDNGLSERLHQLWLSEATAPAKFRNADVVGCDVDDSDGLNNLKVMVGWAVDEIQRRKADPERASQQLWIVIAGHLDRFFTDPSRTYSASADSRVHVRVVRTAAFN